MIEDEESYKEAIDMFWKDLHEDLVAGRTSWNLVHAVPPVIEELPGGSTPSQYALPEGAKELQDLIEFREMNYALGNIFKACYRLGHCNHSDTMRDLRKIKWFVERLIKQEESK